MPRDVVLKGFHMDVSKENKLRETPEGGVDQEPIYTLILTDATERIRISFDRDSRDELVRKLTDGVVLAGGGFPPLRPQG